MNLTRKSAWTGRLFVLPFYIGFAFFFLGPLVQSLSFVFYHVSLNVGGYGLKSFGLNNLNYIFFVNVDFQNNIKLALFNLLWQAPMIMIASLFIALILKQKFLGRTLVRAIFFLPVIIASGVIISIIKNDTAASSMLSGTVISGGSLFKSTSLQDLLVNSGINISIVKNVMFVSNNIFDLLWRTGIQMIIFLAGLQSISPALYEASAVEGSTAWEDFWKITVPMLSPIILINLFYTVVDSFTDANNSVMKQVIATFGTFDYGFAAAMTWSYFLIIGVVLIIILKVFSQLSKGIN